jgi:filamentous hemagglutinin family protein
MNKSTPSLRLATVNGLCLVASIPVYLQLVYPQPLCAQLIYAQIVPDATLPVNSNVVPGCTVCDINGGTVRGTNLFHSFREFSIPTGGAARFNNALEIQNILTRVTGSNLSHIDGLIQTLGTANLFFLNPNGIVFGANARLQIGGSFLATTATSFKFPDGSEFSAIQPEAPPLLTVHVPLGIQPGVIQEATTITNQGTLAVGQDLTLVAGKLDLQGQLQASRNLTLHATDVLLAQDQSANPFLAQAGEILLLQGDRQITINALTHPTSGLLSGRDLILRSGNTISGDAHYTSGGDFRIETLNNSPGNLSSPRDPIIRAQGNVSFNNYTGASLHILAGGSVIVPGTIYITQPDPANALTETILLSDQKTLVNINGRTFATLDIRAGTTAVGTPLGLTGVSKGFSEPPILGSSPTNANIQIGTIYTPINAEGLVFLTNQYQPNNLQGNIQVGVIDTSVTPFFTNGGSVYMDSRGDITLTNDLNSSASFGNGGNVTLLAAGNTTTRLIDASAREFFSGSGGNVTLHSQGNLTTTSIRADGKFFGSSGAITLISEAGKISVLPNSEIRSMNYGEAKGGDLILQARSVEVGSGSSGAAGNITVQTPDLMITKGQLLAIATDSGNAGSILLDTGTTGKLTIQDRSLILSLTIGTGNAGNIQLDAGQLIAQTTSVGTVTVDGAAFGLSGFTSGGQAGNLRINAANFVELSNTLADNFFDTTLTVSNQSIPIQVPIGLVTSTQSSGNAGHLEINTGRLIVRDGAVVSTSTFQTKQAGNLIVNASDSVEIIGTAKNSEFSSGLFSEAGKNSTGDAGNIQINTQQLRLLNGGSISTSTSQASQGKGGDLAIHADTIELSGSSPSVLTRSALLTTTFGSGEGGNLSIDTRQLRILNGAVVASSTLDQGASGNLTINASESVEVFGTAFDNLPTTLATGTAGKGNGGKLTINTQRLTVGGGGLITAATYDEGEGGSIVVNASKSVDLFGQAPDGRPSGISAGSGIAGYANIANRLFEVFGFDKQVDPENATGAGGSLSIVTDQFWVREGAKVSTETLRSGVGGNIQIQANSFAAISGGELRTTTFGSGNAGDIKVLVRDRIFLANPGSGLFADTAIGSTGNGGNIFIDPPTVLIQDRAGIGVDSQGSGQGGSISLQAGSLTLDRQGFITAETASSKGGDITLKVGDILFLRRNSLISATAGKAQGGGDGGNIRITASFVIGVLSENSDIRANAFTGRGGDVTINAQAIFGLRFQLQDTPFSDITASSQFGVSGTVTLNLLNSDPSRGLVVLPFTLVDPSRYIAQGCKPKEYQEGNSFIFTGRGGIPLGPNDPLQSQTILTEWISLDKNVAGGVSKIQDARGLVGDRPHEVIPPIMFGPLACP